MDTKALVIDNPANVCLVATNDSADEYYLYVGTELGTTTVVEFGPCLPDTSVLMTRFSLSYAQFEYKDKKVDKVINNFLGNLARGITSVRITTVNELRELLPDMSKVMI